MSRKDISILAIRILALYTLILTVSSFGTLTFSIFGNFQGVAEHGINQNGVIMASILHTTTLLALTVILWVFSKQISELMNADLEDSMGKEKTHALDIHSILLSTMGIFVAVSAFPHVFNRILSLVSPQTFSGIIQPSRFLIDISPSFLQLIIGLFLAFKSNKVVALLHKR